MRSCRDFDELVRTIAEQASEKYRVLGEPAKFVILGRETFLRAIQNGATRHCWGFHGLDLQSALGELIGLTVVVDPDAEERVCVVCRPYLEAVVTRKPTMPPNRVQKMGVE